MIKAVTFDLDGVYFSGNSYQNFKNSFPNSVSNPDLVNLVLSQSTQMMDFKKGLLSETEFWDYARQALQTNLDNDAIAALIADSYQVNPQVVSVVRKVRSLGIKTCICTNNFPTRINALNQKFGFLSDFDVQVFSYQIGAIKPDLNIFHSLISQSGCQPSEIVFADDVLQNVDGALSLGIKSFIYTGFDDFVNHLRELEVAI